MNVQSIVNVSESFSRHLSCRYVDGHGRVRLVEWTDVWRKVRDGGPDHKVVICGPLCSRTYTSSGVDLTYMSVLSEFLSLCKTLYTEIH